MTLRLLAALAVGGIGSGCVETVPFETVARGAFSGYRAQAALVIRTDEEWQGLWEAHTAAVVPKPARPVVDFQKEMVIAVFLGERPTGGFAAAITAIRRRAGSLEVLIEDTAPDPGGMVAQAFTSPYHIVRLRRIDLPVHFEFRAAR